MRTQTSLADTPLTTCSAKATSELHQSQLYRSVLHLTVADITSHLETFQAAPSTQTPASIDAASVATTPLHAYPPVTPLPAPQTICVSSVSELCACGTIDMPCASLSAVQLAAS